MERISVIVPIYKVEAYLDKCVQSIVDQTYTDLEIILVDDGSPDRCGDMCEAWAKKDSRIKVIHKENGGLSDARNAGMAIAAGEYICFVDSDDWINPRYVELLHTAVVKHQASVAACDVTPFYENDAVCTDISQPIQCASYTSEAAIATLINGTHFRAVAWNKLFRRDLLQGEQFPVGKYHEDEFFSYRILAKAETLVYVDVPLYYYLQRSGSIMTSVSVRHLDALDAGLQRLSFLEEHYPALYRADKVTFCVCCVYFYRNALPTGHQEQKMYIRKVRWARRQVRFRFTELLSYPKKHIMYILASRICPRTLCKLLTREKKESVQ